MNEQQSTPEPNLPEAKPEASYTSPASSPHFSSAPDGAAALRRRMRLLTVLLLLVIAALAAQWWTSHTELRSLRNEVAQRLQSGDNTNNEVKGVLKAVQENTKELQAKVSVLDSKQAESQSQQLALEQMYQDLNKNRDDWALSEIEDVLSTADQQLELAGNVQGALIALQNADKNLSRSDKPQFIAIRRAIARDIDRLKALPTVDIAGIAVRLDSAIGQVDNMPLLVDEKPVESATEPKRMQPIKPAKAANGKAAGDAKAADLPAEPSAWSQWLAGAQDTWQSMSTEMWAELKQLVRIREVQAPDAILLSPGQAYFVRENLKLRLLNARLALLSRNEFAFRNDLSAAQDNIAKYFDTRAKQVQTTQALLKQVQGSNLSIQMPSLAESLNAVRNYKARR
ncbi:uroporphyrinogen-III C-methyltransferase [Herbaspirillum sp. SJZ099]|uniref:uroporphyrinogen-III C-methyltransferase n=1 Tax=Herbaspirillum sp. SJZ099 TaxID=2572916 RepID=UPI0011A1FA39|nr:uroporphyrinogen-III C-methyltransferase [Herbaspirillum sp. SJZ099]TWC71699.1 uroporphyrin-3 C-methyltransferase/uroporphyrinogen III methyltransferase/synthase [Herbaspirillum sp. SJZ099]